MTTEEQLQERLDALMARYRHDTSLDHDSRISFDGEMRGVGFALAVLRGTSAMDEVLAADKRVGSRP